MSVSGSAIILSESILVARPEGDAEQLLLLFHGAGGTPTDMRLLGERLAAVFPQACVVSVCAPQPLTAGGYQWFEEQDASEEAGLRGVEAAMPAFLETVRYWQTQSGTRPELTALIGFAQGATMALEATHETPLVARRVASLAGRFLRLPEAVTDTVTLYLLHGKNDPQVHYGYTVSAAEYLVARDGDVTADVLPYVGHELSAEMIGLLIERLRTHVPQRLWREAIRAQPRD